MSKGNFPWGILLMSIAIAVVLRPLFKDNIEYFLACTVGGAVLGVVSAALEGVL